MHAGRHGGCRGFTSSSWQCGPLRGFDPTTGEAMPRWSADTSFIASLELEPGPFHALWVRAYVLVDLIADPSPGALYKLLGKPDNGT